MEDEYDKYDQHVLIRFSDKLDFVAHNGTIKEHKEILKKKGHVWFGKFGRKICKDNISYLNLQIQGNIPTVLFLVQTCNKENNVYMAFLSNVSSSISEKDLESVPAYYQSYYKEISVWFRFSKITKLSTNALKHILISSSGRPASEILRKSMSSVFIVDIDNKISVKDLKKNQITL